MFKAMHFTVRCTSQRLQNSRIYNTATTTD